MDPLHARTSSAMPEKKMAIQKMEQGPGSAGWRLVTCKVTLPCIETFTDCNHAHIWGQAQRTGTGVEARSGMRRSTLKNKHCGRRQNFALQHGRKAGQACSVMHVMQFTSCQGARGNRLLGSGVAKRQGGGQERKNTGILDKNKKTHQSNSVALPSSWDVLLASGLSGYIT